MNIYIILLHMEDRYRPLNCHQAVTRAAALSTELPSSVLSNVVNQQVNAVDEAGAAVTVQEETIIEPLGQHLLKLPYSNLPYQICSLGTYGFSMKWTPLGMGYARCKTFLQPQNLAKSISYPAYGLGI
ncbi:hypothetical protein GB937_010648 [Aspergillus fischeri]|nr:hypothetical protein GB937_010648 [Aspergillus fischeri]